MCFGADPMFKITTRTGENFKMGQQWNIFIIILLSETTKLIEPMQYINAHLGDHLKS